LPTYNCSRSVHYSRCINNLIFLSFYCSNVRNLFVSNKYLVLYIYFLGLYEGSKVLSNGRTYLPLSFVPYPFPHFLFFLTLYHMVINTQIQSNINKFFQPILSANSIHMSHVLVRTIRIDLTFQVLHYSFHYSYLLLCSCLLI